MLKEVVREAAYGWPGGAKLWAAETPKPAKQPGVNQVQSLTVSPDGRHFATVAMRHWVVERDGRKFGYGAECVADLWDAATGERVRRLADGPRQPAVYARDGSLILTGATGAVIPKAGGGSATPG